MKVLVELTAGTLGAGAIDTSVVNFFLSLGFWVFVLVRLSCDYFIPFCFRATLDKV